MQTNKAIPVQALRNLVLSREFIENSAIRLRTLNTSKALLFSMYFIHGYSTTQLAEFLGVKDYTISRRLRRIVLELNGEGARRSSWHSNKKNNTTERE